MLPTPPSIMLSEAKPTVYPFFLFFILGCFVLPLSGISQTTVPAKLKWGKEYKEPSNTLLTDIIYTDGNGVYALRQKRNLGFNLGNKVFLEKYNRSMTLMKSKEVNLKYSGKVRQFEEVVRLGDQLYFLTSYHNQAKQTNFLFMETLSLSRLYPDNDLRKIAESEVRGLNGVYRFDFDSSPDSSKLLVYNQLPSRKREPERFAFRVFDVGMELSWEKEIALPYSDETFSVEEYQVDDEGNVYLLGVIYEDKTRVRRQGKPTYLYTILTYKNGGEEVEEYRVDLDDKFVTDLTFRVANDGSLVCSGFYSDRGTYSIKGTCYFRVDPKSKNIYNLNTRPFDFEFVTEYLSDRGKERVREAEEAGKSKRTSELYNYKLDELVLRSDGGALLIAEQYYIYDRTFRDFNGHFNTTYYYNYNDIILVNIRPTGEIEWTTRIPKRQQSINDGGFYSSYAMSIVRDRIFFVYNDNIRNLESGRRNSDRIHYYNGSNSVIALAEVRQDGSVTTYPLFSNRDAEIITRPKICKQIGGREMLIYGEKGRRYKFASLQLLP